MLVVPVDKPLLYSVLTDIHSSYVMDNGRVQECTIFLDFEKNFAHARAKCTRLSFLSGCNRKRRTPRKETGYEVIHCIGLVGLLERIGIKRNSNTHKLPVCVTLL